MERLIKYFVPEKYRIWLKIDKNKGTLSGEEVILGSATGVGEVQLHSVGNNVTGVEINGKKADFVVKNGILRLSEALEGSSEIRVRWDRGLNENMQGAYISRYQGPKGPEIVVSTQFESHYARECFPCVDEPEAKAVFELHVESADPDDIILVNTENNGQETPKMSTYLLAFVVGKFHAKSVVNKHGVKITTYCPLNQDPATLDFANEVAAKSLDFYDDKFGVAYPLPKLDQVAIPDFEAGAMENWGLVTYREACLLVDKKSSIEAHKSVAVTVAHELSHQWFGDLVTMRWWDDLWLNESFASVMEYVAVDAFYPEYNIFEDFFTGDCLAAFRRDALPGVQSVKQDVNDPEEIATLFDGAIVYAKGAHLMLMLMRLMSEEKFFAGVAEYFKKFAYGNTCGDDLWECLGAHADFDVKALMEAWISRPGYPVISPSGKQRRFLNGVCEECEPWPLPETTDDMSGHYLLQLSKEEFEKQLERFDTLGFEQKMRLISDRLMLAKTEEVSAADLLDILVKFAGEKSAALWELLMLAIAELKLFFEHDSPEEAEFKGLIRDLIRPQIERLGLEPKEGEPQDDTFVRSDVLGLAYFAEDEEVLAKLAEMVDGTPSEAELKEISAEIRDDVLAARLYTAEKAGDESIFGWLLAEYQKAADPGIKSDLLATMCLAKSPRAAERLLSLLTEPKIVKPQDHIYLYIYLRRNWATREKALKWLTENWEYLEEMTGEKSIEDYPRCTAGTIRTRAEAEIFYNFFDKMRNLPVLKRSLAMARAEIEAKLALITSDRPKVEEKLKNLKKSTCKKS